MNFAPTRTRLKRFESTSEESFPKTCDASADWTPSDPARDLNALLRVRSFEDIELHQHGAAARWRCQPKGFLREALIDTDGTVAPTFGECKGGMALSYKGIWGYAPLVVSLANTNEVLYLVNRPGNVVSHEGCVPWIDRAIKLVAPLAGQITLRGDTDFSLTAELDRWDAQGVQFIFGIDAHPKVVHLAEALPEEVLEAPGKGSRATRSSAARDASPSGSRKASCVSRAMRTRCWSARILPR